MAVTCPGLHTKHHQLGKLPQLRSHARPSAHSAQPPLRTGPFQTARRLAFLLTAVRFHPPSQWAPTSSENLSLRELPALKSLPVFPQNTVEQVIESRFQLWFPFQSLPFLGLSRRGREQASSTQTCGPSPTLLQHQASDGVPFPSNELPPPPFLPPSFFIFIFIVLQINVYFTFVSYSRNLHRCYNTLGKKSKAKQMKK